MLLVALVPLAAAGILTLDLLEHSAREQVQGHQQQLGQAAAAMVRNYIREGQTRLKLIAGRLPKGKDPAELGKQLDLAILSATKDAPAEAKPTVAFAKSALSAATSAADELAKVTKQVLAAAEANVAAVFAALEKPLARA